MGLRTGDWRGRPEAGMAYRAARLERSLLLRDISQMQVRVIDWSVNEPLYPLVRAALNPVHFQRGGLTHRKGVGIMRKRGGETDILPTCCALPAQLWRRLAWLVVWRSRGRRDLLRWLL